MELHIVNQLPVVIADNLYSYKEYKMMFDEFKRIKERGLLMSGNETGGGLMPDGQMKKKNQSVFLDTLYKDRRLSDILVCNRKLFSASTMDSLINIHPFFHYIPNCNNDSTLLSYYDNNNSYDEHRDTSIVTALTWFYEEPKKFEGGEFVVEGEFVIECKANRTVFMPSCMLHAVNPVKPEVQNKGLGRYTMTQFMDVFPTIN